MIQGAIEGFLSTPKSMEAIATGQGTMDDYLNVAAFGATMMGMPAGRAIAPGISGGAGAGRTGLAATAKQLPVVRGLAKEERVLKDMGLSKNKQYVKTGEGRSKPDSLTDKLSVEIKDTDTVSDTRQVRIQTDAARRDGRTSILVTGDRTYVTPQAMQSFDQIIRRSDLGPQP